MKVAELLAEYKVDTSDLAKAEKRVDRFSKRAERQNKKTATSFQNLNRRVGALANGLRGTAIGMGAVAIAGTALIRGISEATKAFAQYDANLRTTEQLLIATGNTSGKTTAQLEAQARQIGLSTLASADGVRKAQNILLTFKGISGDVFDRLLNTAQDFAQILGTDITQTTQQLAKAFEDPARNLSNLRRIGVSFTEEQAKQIKNLQEQNKLIQAQRQLLSVLEGQAGGAGVAAAEGLAGQYDTLGEVSSDFAIAVGSIIGQSRLFRDALSGMISAISNATSFLYDIADRPDPRDTPEEQLEVARRRQTEAQKQFDDGIDAIMKRSFKETPQAFQYMTNQEQLEVILAGRRAVGRLIDIMADKELPEGVSQTGLMIDFHEQRYSKVEQARMRGGTNLYANQPSIQGPTGGFQLELPKHLEDDPMGKMLFGMRLQELSMSGILPDKAIELRTLTQDIDRANEDIVRVTGLFQGPTHKRFTEPGTPMSPEETNFANQARIYGPLQGVAAYQDIEDERRNERIAARNAETNEHMESLNHLFELEQEKNRLIAEAEEEAFRKREERRKKFLEQELAQRREQVAAIEAIMGRGWAQVLQIEQMSFSQNATMMAGQLQLYSDFMNQMAEKGGTAFLQAKRLAQAQAIVQGIAATVASFNFGAQIGGPVLGGVFAAVAMGATSALIAQIEKTRFEGRRAGGSVLPGHAYVAGGDHGTEGLAIGNKTLIIPGKEAGRVTPSTGMAQGKISVTVINKTGTNAQARATQSQGPNGMQVLVELVKAGIQQDMVNGGNEFSNSMEATYGLQRSF